MTVVEFRVDGHTLRGTLTLPAELTSPPPIVVRAPGWMSVAAAPHYRQYDTALTTAGFAVLAIDYRGLGASDPATFSGSPFEMIHDVLGAVGRAAELSQVDRSRLGVFASGGIGAAAALVAASLDRRVRATALLSPIADGAAWMRHLRTAEEWRNLLGEQEADRTRAAGGQEREVISPVGGVMPETETRRRTGFKREISGELPASVSRKVVDDILMFTAIPAAARLSPRALLMISCETDIVVPDWHARRLYEAAHPPKQWIVLPDTTSYEAHNAHGSQIASDITAHFRRHMGDPQRTIVE